MSKEHEQDKLERLLSDWGASQGGRTAGPCLTMTQAAAVAAGSEGAGPAWLEHSRSCPRCARLVGKLESAEEAQESGPAGSGARGQWSWAPWALAACLALTSGLLILASTMLRSQRQELVVTRATAAALAQEVEQVHQQAQQVQARAAESVAKDSRQLEDLAKRIDQAERSASQQAALASQVESLRQELARVQQTQLRREAAVDATWRMLVGQAAAEPSSATVAAMQSAARSADLAGRAAALGEAAQEDAELARLLNRLEAVLLRLEMANPGSAADRRWIAQLAQAGLIEGIDAVVAEPASAPAESASPKVGEELRLLLAQSRAILLRGLCAG